MLAGITRRSSSSLTGQAPGRSPRHQSCRRASSQTSGPLFWEDVLSGEVRRRLTRSGGSRSVQTPAVRTNADAASGLGLRRTTDGTRPESRNRVSDSVNDNRCGLGRTLGTVGEWFVLRRTPTDSHGRCEVACREEVSQASRRKCSRGLDGDERSLPGRRGVIGSRAAHGLRCRAGPRRRWRD